LHDRCPQCGNLLICDPEHGEIVCPHCGLVVDDRPLVHVGRSNESERHGRRITFNIGDTWLRASLGVVWDLYGHVFFDQCTLKTAEIILNEIHKNVPRRKLPDYELAAKFAILIASRKCGEIVELKRLLKASEIHKLISRHEHLRKLYTPLNKSEQVTQLALKIAMCLEDKGVKNATRAVAERVRELKVVSGKPLNIAIAVVHSVLGADTGKIAECSNTTIDVVKRAIRRFPRLF
jgi:transcription initiation factor TFIIIB Brf1 subunit/transcription initiation factor TFIIB